MLSRRCALDGLIGERATGEPIPGGRCARSSATFTDRRAVGLIDGRMPPFKRARLFQPHLRRAMRGRVIRDRYNDRPWVTGEAASARVVA
jgi:hypothetical protein